jgi:acylphosphatase
MKGVLMSDEIKAYRIRVEGRVQGVFFRATTKKAAGRYDILGYAKNLPDGSVEIWAQGSQANLDVFMKWVHKGPPLARVDRVAKDELPVDANLVDFKIAR